MQGFSRKIRITPAANSVQAELEDDFHCMSVVIHHDGYRATYIKPDMRRVPWTTCPGAEQELVQTFSNLPLQSFSTCGEKKKNCTHLFDLSVWAAKHAQKTNQIIYDIFVSDPEDENRNAEISCNGKPLLSWVEAGFKIVEPKSAKGLRLDKLRAWIETLPDELQEPARLLQWGNMLANGRVIPLENQSDATKMPPSCYTFQPSRAIVAKRVGEIRDFSRSIEQPLQEYEPVV